MKTLVEIMAWLEANKPLLQEQFSIKELGIFGSYLRHEQTGTSDVDILVEFSQHPAF